ncbi:MAG: hypothetical protein Q7T97_10125 [Burkholderiaceae bacterium]|nr:hypothetical protein [Burkholderiaceae bacterium]
MKKAARALLTALACGALMLGCFEAAVAAQPSRLTLVCSGLETVEIIYGTELEPTRKGDFRVEYNIDLDRKSIANPRNGKLTSINIDDKEISFGTATDFNPDAKDLSGPKTNGPVASATGVVINRSNGRYFSIATRKQFSAELPPEGGNEPIVTTNVRTRQGVCTDGTPSPSF